MGTARIVVGTGLRIGESNNAANLLYTSAIPTQISNIQSKSFEGWFILDPAAMTLPMAGGLGMSAGSAFDAIVYAELVASNWMVGSDFYSRTTNIAQTAETSTGLIHIVITYTYGATATMTLYRNGVALGTSYQKGVLPTYPADSSVFHFGPRWFQNPTTYSGFFNGHVVAAAHYDTALSGAQVAALHANPPGSCARALCGVYGNRLLGESWGSLYLAYAPHCLCCTCVSGHLHMR
jgi:hypothetical protein